MKKLTQKQIEHLLIEVANDFETNGCDGCGTISIKTMNKVREVLGWEPLEDSEDPT